MKHFTKYPKSIKAATSAKRKSHVCASSEDNSILITEDFCDALYDALNDAGCDGDDADLVTYCLYRDDDGKRINFDKLVKDLIDDIISARINNGFGDEMEGVDEWLAKIVPDAVNKAVNSTQQS